MGEHCTLSHSTDSSCGILLIDTSSSIEVCTNFVTSPYSQGGEIFTANKEGIQKSVHRGAIVKVCAAGFYKSVKYEHNLKKMK